MTKLLLILALLLYASEGYTAPTIGGVAGNMLHGQSVTITGTGFGAKSPAAPLLYDPVFGQSTYAGLVDGDTIPKGTGYPWPTMAGSGTVPPLYKTTNPRGKTLACYSNYANSHWSPYTGSSDYGQAVVGNVDFSTYCNGSTGTGKLYISWWMYPYGYNYNTNNFWAADKLMRVTPNGQWETAGYVFAAQGQAQLYDFTLGYLANVYMNPAFVTDSWNRIEYQVDNKVSPKPNVKAFTNLAQVSSVTASSPGFSVDICGIPDMGADYSNDAAPIKMDFGEIYIDSTPARIEVCNSATWAARTHCEIQIPSAWSDTSITAAVNQGSFTDGSTAYLYVVDSTGVVSGGQSVSFGGAVAATGNGFLGFGLLAPF